jgi:transposase-like protein
MSTMPETKRKRTRRGFTDEFKAGAVRLVLDVGTAYLGKFRFDSVVVTYAGIMLLVAVSLWNIWPRRVSQVIRSSGIGRSKLNQHSKGEEREAQNRNL